MGGRTSAVADVPLTSHLVDSSAKDELPLSRFTGSECFRK